MALKRERPAERISRTCFAETSVLRTLCLTINSAGPSQGQALDVLSRMIFTPDSQGLFTSCSRCTTRGDYIVLTNIKEGAVQPR